MRYGGKERRQALRGLDHPLVVTPFNKVPKKAVWRRKLAEWVV
jgi:hypothetical protein